ncbi:MAG: hypothetical protein ACLP7Q_24845 [Isosphaeraceae bacterium]
MQPNTECRQTGQSSLLLCDFPGSVSAVSEQQTSIGMEMPNQSTGYSGSVGRIATTTSGDASSATTLGLEKEDIEYLNSIAELTSEMRPFVELESLAKGCPDPTRYAGDQKHRS